jgi:hypothetical protein
VPRGCRRRGLCRQKRRRQVFADRISDILSAKSLPTG